MYIHKYNIVCTCILWESCNIVCTCILWEPCNIVCIADCVHCICDPFHRLLKLAQDSSTSNDMLTDIATLLQNVFQSGGGEGRKNALNSGVLDLTIKLLNGRDPIPVSPISQSFTHFSNFHTPHTSPHTHTPSHPHSPHTLTGHMSLAPQWPPSERGWHWLSTHYHTYTHGASPAVPWTLWAPRQWHFSTRDCCFRGNIRQWSESWSTTRNERWLWGQWDWQWTTGPQVREEGPLLALFLRAYNLSLVCPISKLKYAFYSSLIGLSDYVLGFGFFDGPKSTYFVNHALILYT